MTSFITVRELGYLLDRWRKPPQPLFTPRFRDVSAGVYGIQGMENAHILPPAVSQKTLRNVS
jgi:hypothetical protein